MRALATTVAVCLLALSIPQDAKATLVTFEMGGVLGCGDIGGGCGDEAGNALFAAETGYTPLPDPLNPWTFLAYLTVDTAAEPDSPGTYSFSGPNTNFTVQIGGLTLVYTDFSVALRRSFFCNGAGDSFSVNAGFSTQFALATSPPECMNVLADYTLEALAMTSQLDQFAMVLSVEPPITRSSPDGHWRRVTGATYIKKVPEPATSPLIIVGLMGLLFLRVSQRRVLARRQ